jgi:hypothetical protein
MIATSIIGIATATVGAFFVFPLFAGAFVAGQCMLHTGRLTREEKLFKDIEGRIAKILEKSDAV